MKEKGLKKILCFTMSILLVGASFAACNTETSSSLSSSSDSGSASSSSKPQPVTNKTYQSYWMKQFDYKTMPICAFNGAPLKIGNYTQSMISDEHFKTMSEAYFNVTYAMYDTAIHEEVKDSLKYAQKYNISYMAVLGGLPTDINILQSQIYNTLMKDSPRALGGVLVSDEPGRLRFDSVANSRNLYETLLGKKVLMHCNLYPKYASAQQLYGGDLPAEGYTYDQYVDEFLEIYDPQVLSYDYYPLNANGISQPYFENMSVIREKAAEKEIPFWVYIQSCSYNKSKRIPSESDIAWLVNTSLAYGAKGLQYFCYVDAVSSGSENFNGSPINAKGEKTDTYYHVQKANKFVSEVDEVLMCCLSKGLMAAGETPCPIPEGDILSSYGALKSVEGESVLVGCFDYNGRSAYYVVNNGISAACTAKLTFNGAANGFLQTSSGKTDIVGKSTLDIGLEAGTAALVVLD